MWSAKGPLEQPTAAATKFSAVGERLIRVPCIRRTPVARSLRDNHLD